MADFTGGYTSAVNSQTDRVGQEATAAHIMQLIDARKRAEQVDIEDRQRQMAARANAGSILPALLQAMQGSGGPPMGAPQGPAPQPMGPGQASVPMMHPGAGPDLMSMIQQSMPPPGAPAPQGTPSPMESPVPEAAAPMPVGWQGMPPGAGGITPAPENVAQAEIPGAGLPPAQPRIPPQLLSVPMVIKAMQERNTPPDQMLDTLGQLMPVIEKDNRLAFAQLKAETEAEKAANSAYRLVIDKFKAETGRTDVESKVARRTISGEQSVRQNDIRAATAGARSGGGAAGVTSGLTEDAINDAAERYRRTGVIPALYRDPVSKQLIMNRSAEQARELGQTSSDVVTGQQDQKAIQTAYTQITKDIAAIRPYNEMLEKNATIAKDLAKKAIATNSQLANRPLNWLRQNVGDNPDVAEYMAQIRIVQTEAARVLNNPRLVGQLTDSARHEMEGIVNGDMPLNATVRVIDRLISDGKNRTSAMESEAAELKRARDGPQKAAGPGGVRVNVTADQSPAGKAAMQADIALKGKVEAAGQKYEPDKFDYKVEGGKVFRKPK